MLANLETATHPDEIDSNALKQAFLEDYELSANVYLTAKKLGMNRVTFYNHWLKNDSEFKARVEEIRSGHVLGIEGNLISEGLHNKKAVTNQIFALKCLLPEIYGDRYEISANSTINFNYQGLAEGLVKALDQSKAVGLAEVINTDVVKEPEMGKDK